MEMVMIKKLLLPSLVLIVWYFIARLLNDFILKESVQMGDMMIGFLGGSFCQLTYWIMVGMEKEENKN
jgi:hypothetical protein